MTPRPSSGRSPTMLDALAHGWRVSTHIALAHDFLDAEWIPRDSLLFVSGRLAQGAARTMDEATELAARTHVERDAAQDAADAYRRNESEARDRDRKARVARGELDSRDRAALYLSRMDAAIAGSGASQHAMWAAALAMVRGFNLSQDVALDLLVREWNPRCQPPRPRTEIVRSVRNAARSTTAAGYLLDARRTA